VRGPFKSWLHRHIVTPIDDHTSTLRDDIEYELPLGALGRIAGGWFARGELERLFEHRHAVTKRYCERHVSTLK
jgi:ligand-binding SRPBCC domain-containing protein